MDLSRCVEPSSACRAGGGLGRGRGGGGREDSDRSRGSLSGFAIRGGGHLRVGASRADGIEVSWEKLRDAGLTSIGKIGGLPGVGMGLGEGRGISVANVVKGIDAGEVWVESGAVVLGGNRGGWFVLEFGSDLRGGLGCQGWSGEGSAYPM